MSKKITIMLSFILGIAIGFLISTTSTINKSYSLHEELTTAITNEYGPYDGISSYTYLSKKVSQAPHDYIIANISTNPGGYYTVVKIMDDGELVPLFQSQESPACDLIIEKEIPAELFIKNNSLYCYQAEELLQIDSLKISR